MLEARAVLVLQMRPSKVYEGKTADGQPYAVRSIVGDGYVFLGSDDENQDTAKDLELACFRQDAKDPLFYGLSKLSRGDEVEVYFTLEWVRFRDSRGRDRKALKPGRLTSLKVF